MMPESVLDYEPPGHRPQPMFQPLTADQRRAWENWIEFHSPRVARQPPPDPFDWIVLVVVVLALTVFCVYWR